MMKTSLKALLLLLPLFMTLSTVAAEKMPEGSTLGDIAKKYDEIKKTLTPEQIAILDTLDKEQGKASEPMMSLTMNAAMFGACSKKDPTLLQTHGKMMQTFQMSKIDEGLEARKKLRAMYAQANFIDPYILGGHHQRQEAIQNALGDQLAQIATQVNKDIEAKCAELKKELETVAATPYAETSSYVPHAATTRAAETGRLESCFLGFGHYPGKNSVSTRLVLVQPEGKTVYDYSTKITDPSGKALPVEESWLHIGPIDTRFIAQTTKPGEQILIGYMPVQHVISTLIYLKDNPLIGGVRAGGWEKTIAFESPMVAPAELEKFANCAAAIEPKLADPLKKAGYTITPDEQHAKALSEPAPPVDPYYKASRMSDDPENPGACVWQLTAPRNGAREMGGALITAGDIANGNPLNNKTVFWVLGAEHSQGGTSRLSFSDATFAVKNPKDGKIISTSDFKPQISKGQRFEIHMPFESYVTFVTGIQAGGFTLTGQIEGDSKPFELKFPAPTPISYKAYYNCVEALVKHKAKGKPQ